MLFSNVIFRSATMGRCVVRTVNSVRPLCCPTANENKIVTAKVQHEAPHFELKGVMPNFTFKDVKSTSEEFKNKYLVIFFYPLDFTFVCPTELIAFSDRIEEFNALNCKVVGVSTDSHFSHLAWIQMDRQKGGLGGKLNYPLLSDFKKQMSMDYGVLVEDAGIALRGLFILDSTRVVRHISVNDLPVGRSVDEVLRLVKAFQFVEKNGEVCPANWNEGGKTIKPTPNDSLQYFKQS